MSFLSDHRDEIEDVLRKLTDNSTDIAYVNVYIVVGTTLASSMDINPKDPLAVTEDMITQDYEPEERKELTDKLRVFATYLFREIDREDLLRKYNLRIH